MLTIGNIIRILIFVIIVRIIIFQFNLTNKSNKKKAILMKDYGSTAEAEILGYIPLKGSNYKITISCIVLKFKDKEQKEHIIVKTDNQNIQPRYDVGHIMNITYIERKKLDDEKIYIRELHFKYGEIYKLYSKKGENVDNIRLDESNKKYYVEY